MKRSPWQAVVSPFSRSDFFMSYKKQLTHPAWQKRRLQIFERDGWECVKCGDSETELQVHHKYYEQGKKVWDYPDNALVTLCQPCHFKEEMMLKDIPTTLMSNMRLAGVDGSQLLSLEIIFNNLKGQPDKTRAVIELTYRLSNCDIDSIESFILYAQKLSIYE